MNEGPELCSIHALRHFNLVSGSGTSKLQSFKGADLFALDVGGCRSFVAIVRWEVKELSLTAINDHAHLPSRRLNKQEEKLPQMFRLDLLLRVIWWDVPHPCIGQKANRDCGLVEQQPRMPTMIVVSST